MLPLLGALIGAGGSVASGILGAQAQDNAAAYNYYVNMLNYYQRERERQDRIREASRIEREQKQGATDAYGNRTRFIEGQGWTTQLSPESRRLADAQRQEQMNVLQQDLPMRRQAMQRAAAQGDQTNDMANVLLERFRQGVEEDPEAVRRLMVGAATGAINREYDQLTSAAMRKATRTGASNTGRIIADLARDRMQQIAGAVANIPLQAKQFAQGMTQAREGNLLNQYNMLASRAAQVPGVAYQPQNIEGGLNNLMTAFANRSDKGAGMLMDAHKIPGGTYDYTQANTGWANAVGGGAGAIAGALERAGGYMDRQNALSERQAFGNRMG